MSITAKDPTKQIPMPPTFATVEEERLHRKRAPGRRLPAVLRSSASTKAWPGTSPPATPRTPSRFWVNPFARALRPHLGLRPHPGERPGRGGRGEPPGQPGRLRHPLPGPRGPPRRGGRRPLALGLRQGLVDARPPARPAHPGRVRLLRGPRPLRRLHRRRDRHRGGQAHRRTPSATTRPSSCATTACLTVGHSVDEAAWWFITMERSCQAQLLAEAAGTPVSSTRRWPAHTATQVGNHFSGWLSFQPLSSASCASSPTCSTDPTGAAPPAPIPILRGTPIVDRPLTFGTFIAPFHPVGQNPTLAIERDLELVVRLDQLGYDEAWIGEHHSAGYEIIASPEVFIAVAAAAHEAHPSGHGRELPALPPPVHAGRPHGPARPHDPGPGHVRRGPRRAAVRRLHDGHRPGRQREMMEESLEAILALLDGSSRSTRETDWFTLNNARLQLRPYHPTPASRWRWPPRSRRPARGRRDGSACPCSPSAPPPPAASTCWGPTGRSWRSGPSEFDHRRPAQWRLVGPMHIAETEEQARRDVAFGLASGSTTSSAWPPCRWPPRPYVDEMVDAIIDTGLRRRRHTRDGDRPDRAALEQSGGFGTFLLMAHEWADRRGHPALLRALRPRGHAPSSRDRPLARRFPGLGRGEPARTSSEPRGRRDAGHPGPPPRASAKQNVRNTVVSAGPAPDGRARGQQPGVLGGTEPPGRPRLVDAAHRGGVRAPRAALSAPPASASVRRSAPGRRPGPPGSGGSRSRSARP